MKIERQSKTFTPVTITIESQVELDALLIGMNHSESTFRSFRDSISAATDCNLKDLIEAKDDLWLKLSKFK